MQTIYKCKSRSDFTDNFIYNQLYIKLCNIFYIYIYIIYVYIERERQKASHKNILLQFYK